MLRPVILVATWNEGLFVINGDERRQEFPGQAVRGLAPNGRGGAIAIVGKHLLLRRAPDGGWASIATSESELSCCVAVRDSVYVGTEDARLLRVRLEGGVLEPVAGFDSVAGRDAWYAGSAVVNGERLGPPLGVRSMASSANGTLFANVHVGGVPRSVDDGRSWQPTIDIENDVHEVRAHPTNPDLVVAASARGLCISRDAGATWIVEQDGLHASHCYAVAFSGDDILVSAATDPFAAQGKVYRRPIRQGGSPVAIEGRGMPKWTAGVVDTGSVAAVGSMVAVADRSGNLYLSEDDGWTWSSRGPRLPTPSGVLIC